MTKESEDLKELEPPIGKFILDNLPIEKRVITPNGVYIHYSDVCQLLKKQLSEQQSKHEQEMKQYELEAMERRADIEDLEAQVKQLKVENLRLIKKLEYVYNKAYIIYHSANAEKCNSDIIKLWDAVEARKVMDDKRNHTLAQIEEAEEILAKVKVSDDELPF